MTTSFCSTRTSPRTVSISGEVDIATSSELRAALTRADAYTVNVDMSGLSFIDASGLAELVRAGGLRGLTITNPNARVVRAFTVGNLRHLLPSDA